jgi:hypothetical protein
MGKVVKVGGRGTTRRVTDEDKANWSGESFKEYQRKMKEAAGNEYVSMGRGTKKVKLSDIKETKQADTKGRYVSMGRGTGRRKLE